jgi:hypothetical protein
MNNSTLHPSTQRVNGSPSPAVSHQFIASDFKRFEKNTLRGFFCLTLPSGLRIKECSYHQRDDKSWIGLPAKPWTKQDGTISYVNILEFVDKETQYSFQRHALAAIDALLGEGGEQ